MSLLLILQLCDSAWPIGGFAHSQGLESFVKHFEVHDQLLTDLVLQAGWGAIPFANEAFDGSCEPEELNHFAGLFLHHAIAIRASLTLGKTLIHTSSKVFSLSRMQERFRKTDCHYAVAWGLLTRELELERSWMQTGLLYSSLRSGLSALVRLGKLGPLEAQRKLVSLHALVTQTAQACSQLKYEEAAQTAPLLDLAQAQHEQLYSRLFLS